MRLLFRHPHFATTPTVYFFQRPRPRPVLSAAATRQGSLHSEATRTVPPSPSRSTNRAGKQNGQGQLSELARLTAESAAMNDVIEEAELQHKAESLPPDLRSYLQPVGVMETRYVRLLSSLCSQTYVMNKMSSHSLYRRHRLTLVTTSRMCDTGLRRAARSVQEIFSEADAMAAHPDLVRELAKSSPPPPPPGAPGGLAAQLPNATPAPPAPPRAGAALARAAAAAEIEAAAAGASPADLVAASLAAAAGAAAAAAAGVYSAAAASAASTTTQLSNNIQSFTLSVTSRVTSHLPPVRSVAAQLQNAASAGHSTAVATVAAVSAALDSAWGKDRDLPKECQSPTEWFVCDDEVTHTRYFVIQGSDNLDHWKVNLTFDPVAFEDEALGVKVHRGVYEAAQALYDRFLPLVRDHLESSPFARFTFTGHSLGGSLGTLLMLMFVRRGVIPKACLSPVYTFGSPAIFCEGAAGGGCGPCATECSGIGHGPGAAAAAGGILPLLGLPECVVRNVVMHKDIVPRAFACDYSLVADLLRRVGGSFRDHACLVGQHQVKMFNFVGQSLVLQPDSELTFVGGEGYHPMLPPSPGLFLVRDPPAPSPSTYAAAVARRDVDLMARAVQRCADASSDASSADVGSVGSDTWGSPSSPCDPAAASADGSCVIGSRAGPGFGPAPRSAKDALFELMNNPHPLDTLADGASYGPAGRISRYHNPDNYTCALGAVLRSRGASWQRLLRHASEAGLRWHAPVMETAPATLQQHRLLSKEAPGPAGSRSSALGRLRHGQQAQRVSA